MDNYESALEDYRRMLTQGVDSLDAAAIAAMTHGLLVQEFRAYINEAHENAELEAMY